MEKTLSVVRPPAPLDEGFEVVEHGLPRRVSYPWLTDQDRGPRVVEHVKAENAYIDESFNSLGIDAITKEIKAEMLSRLTDHVSAVVVDGAWSYYTKSEKAKSAPSHWRFPTNLDISHSQLLFDEAVESQKVGGQLKLGSLEVSDDGELLLVSFDSTGEEEYTFQVRRISDGKILCEEKDVAADSYEQIGPIFNAKGNGVYFIRHDENQRNASISYREFDPINGGFTTDEVCLYNELDEEYWVSVGISRDLKWAMISTGSSNTSEIFVLDRDNPTKAMKSFAGRNEGLLYGFDILGENAYIVSDLDTTKEEVTGGAEQNLYVAKFDFKIDANLAPVSTWVKSIELPGASTILEDVQLFSTFSAFSVRVDGLQRVMTATRGSDGIHGQPRLVGAPNTMSAQLLTENPLVDSVEFDIIEIGMQPSITYTVTMGSNNESETRVVHTREIPGLDANDYDGELIYGLASDGTKIPVAVLTPKNTPVIGTLLFVYGAYGLSDEIAYNSAWQSLLNRGVACAVAYSRGGGELGQAWYHAGSLSRKATTMTDTFVAAVALRDKGYAGLDGKNIVLQGGSAGGAAVGGTVNLDPTAFAGVIGRVPFVDCLATMLDPTLPLTIGEYAEWGNPTESKSAWLDIKSWAPTENIKLDVKYPPILATAGLNDPRVGIWEPARWILLLREAGNQAYLRTVEVAGHSGASDKFASINEDSERAAFAYWCLNRESEY